MPGSKDLKSLYKYSAAITIIWTILVAGSLVLDIGHKHEDTRNLAIKEARIHFNKDQALRRWATMHGGVYVTPDDKTPPNPYLHVPDRDVKTTSGKSLTLMNPAYMLRQVMDFYSELYGVKGRLTSLNALNPDNRPDAWERSALISFEQGKKEVFEFTDKDGGPHLRFMAPLITEKGCLKCHGFQGYKEGDVRGGITVSVPLTPYLAIEHEAIKNQILTHGIFWLLGLLSIGFVSYRSRRNILERTRVEDALSASEERYRISFDEAPNSIMLFDPETERFVAFNKKAYENLGYTREEFQDIKVSDFEVAESPEEIRAHTNKMLNEGFDIFETRHMRKDGQFRNVLVNARSFSVGRKKFIQVIIIDITERKQAEKALQMEKNKLQTYLDTSAVIVLIIDKDQKVSLINRRGCEILGYNEDEITGKDWFDNFLPARLAGHVKEVFKELMAGGIAPVAYFENEVLTKSGEERMIAWHNTVLRDEEGRIIAALSTGGDITEKNHAEKALKKSEARLAEAQEIARFGNWEWNIKTNEIWWSDEIYRIFGLDYHADVTYELFINTIHPDDRRFVKKAVEQALLENRPYSIDHRIVRPDGVALFVHEKAEVKFDGTGNPVSMVGTVQDVTERIKALHEIESFKILSDNSNDAHFLIDGNAKFLYVNKTACDMTGYDEEELLRLSVPDIDSMYDLGKYQELFKRIHSETVPPVETVNRRKDGTTFPSEITVTGHRIAGKPLAFAALRDVSERKRTEQELLESEERFKGIIDNVNIGVSLIAPDLKLLLVNNQIKKWFGDIDISAAPLCHEVFTSCSMTNICFKCPTLKTLHDGKPHELTIEIPIGGETKSYRIIASPIKNKEGDIISVINLLEDITEHKKLEDHLMHAQKMESIGTLAGGVAHDFNNIITAIMGFTSVLNRRLKDEDPLKVYVKQIKAATENAANLTSSLLTFSRKQKINPTVMDLNYAVKKMGGFLRRIIGEDIEFRTILAAGPLNVKIDVGQMEQVLMNIVSNARDAMPEGGLLTISTELITLDMAFTQSHGYGTPGDYAAISVCDTGTGIDDKTKEKIFEPFFTTKEVNKGTGLGLAIAYGIIKQHNGYITIDNAPEKGTRFRIYLPLTAQLLQEHRKIEKETFPLIMGTETILFAEDEIMIRELIASELTEFGYKVITAIDGEDAVDKFIENKDHIDMIVSDVIMPRKSGKDFYEDIKKTRPDIKTIFLSGYSEELMFKTEPLDENAAFVKKPVELKYLLEKIREMLDSKS